MSGWREAAKVAEVAPAAGLLGHPVGARAVEAMAGTVAAEKAVVTVLMTMMSTTNRTWLTNYTHFVHD